MASTEIRCVDGFTFRVGWGLQFHCSPREEDASAYTVVEAAWWSEKDPDLTKIMGQDVNTETLTRVVHRHGGVESMSQPLPPLEWEDQIAYFAMLAEYGDVINQLVGEHNE